MLHMLISIQVFLVGKLDIRIFLKQNSYFESWFKFFLQIAFKKIFLRKSNLGFSWRWIFDRSNLPQNVAKYFILKEAIMLVQNCDLICSQQYQNLRLLNNQMIVEVLQ
jgi:hypothetical protein